ncbi:XRE family transcriptional regulator [Helicobacter muridarum]|uniref:Helix-turn-helix n=1 Tax=Helicobacter muridarum TaxID=216 RepID=A0A099TZM6_9HELI|nr:helix-turn-helix transcriptional regulator [Helicobacter muridarum]TLD99010.1 XRE family transcriptional regulator [Helicobacter muridarum]STQ85425.1 Helix-turn-helix [Helicobacter muridarum]
MIPMNRWYNGKSGLSQKAFVDSLGVSFRTIQNYEYGVTSPSYDFLQNLSKKYNVSMMFLVGKGEND